MNLHASSAARAKPHTTASWRMIPPGGWYRAPTIGYAGRSERSSWGQSSRIRSTPTTLELTPSSLFTLGSCIVIIARSECASVRWPCCGNMRLKSSSAESRS